MRRALLPLLLLLLLPAATLAQEPRSVVVSAGLFDTAAWFDDRGDEDALEGGVALHGAPRLWGIGPMAGISANDDGGFWVYVGARRPFHFGSCWSLAPNFAAAYYEAGDGKDLGHELEFRSGIALACRGGGGRALGLEYYHLSNASISDLNPGSNSLVVTYAIPLGR